MYNILQVVDNFEDPTNRKRTFVALQNIQTNNFALPVLLICSTPKMHYFFF